jgi:AraC-like DNA-binding protein
VSQHTPAHPPSALDQRPFPTAYLRLVLETLVGDDPPTRQRCLAAAGLDPGIEATWRPSIPFGQARRLVERVVERRAPGWHLLLASRLDAGIHGPLGFAALTAPTLDAALGVLLRYADTRIPFVWLTRADFAERCRVECHPGGDLGPLHRPLLELSLLGVLALVSQVTGRNAAGCRCLLPGEPPPYAEALRRHLQAAPVFHAEVFAVELPAAWLRVPSLLADEGMHRLSLSRCRDTLRLPAGATDLEIGLRQDLLALGGRSPGLAALARRRHVSPRTLMRRLKQAGTSYQRIVDEVHATLAAELLRHGDLPIAEIAARLGFADVANFGRAFRGWFGVPPGRFRDG